MSDKLKRILKRTLGWIIIVDFVPLFLVFMAYSKPEKFITGWRPYLVGLAVDAFIAIIVVLFLS